MVLDNSDNNTGTVDNNATISKGKFKENPKKKTKVNFIKINGG